MSTPGHKILSQDKIDKIASIKDAINQVDNILNCMDIDPYRKLFIRCNLESVSMHMVKAVTDGPVCP